MIGDDVDAIPPSIRVRLSTSVNVEALDLDGDAARPPRAGAGPRRASSIAFTPCQGRAECALSPRKCELARSGSRGSPAGSCCRSAPSSTTRSASSKSGVAAKSSGSALSPAGSSSRGKKRKRGVERELRRVERDPARELDHHRERRLHVGRAEPVHRAVLARPGDVALRRDGVEVAREEDERAARPARRRDEERRRRRRGGARATRGGRPRTCSASCRSCATRRDVDELEQCAASRSVVRVAVMRGLPRRSRRIGAVPSQRLYGALRGHGGPRGRWRRRRMRRAAARRRADNPRDWTPARSRARGDPERGLAVAVLARGSTRRRSSPS